MSRKHPAFQDGIRIFRLKQLDQIIHETKRIVRQGLHNKAVMVELPRDTAGIKALSSSVMFRQGHQCRSEQYEFREQTELYLHSYLAHFTIYKFADYCTPAGGFSRGHNTMFIVTTYSIIFKLLSYNREVGLETCHLRTVYQAKYVEGQPNTTFAWAGWSRFDIPVDRYGGVHSQLICTSITLGSPTCHQCLLPLRRVHEIKRMYLASRTHGLFITQTHPFISCIHTMI